MTYDNTNKGVLFKNHKKVDRQPDYTGKIDVEGKEWQLSAWTKEGKGGKFFSLAIKPPYKKGEQSGHGRNDMDDEIPF